MDRNQAMVAGMAIGLAIGGGLSIVAGPGMIGVGLALGICFGVGFRSDVDEDAEDDAPPPDDDTDRRP